MQWVREMGMQLRTSLLIWVDMRNRVRERCGYKWVIGN